MQSQPIHPSVIAWAQQNLSQPVSIRLGFAARSRTLVYVLLFSVPVLVVAAMTFLKIAGAAKAVAWPAIFVFGIVLCIPGVVILALGARTRRAFARSLGTAGVRSSTGHQFPWEELHYVDHISKRTKTHTIADNQLELVFSGGKVVIPPLIDDRQRIWALINSMPVEVRVDGQVRSGGSAPASFDAIVRRLGEMKAEQGRSR